MVLKYGNLETLLAFSVSGFLHLQTRFYVYLPKFRGYTGNKITLKCLLLLTFGSLEQ